MNSPAPIPFRSQRIIFIALLLGMTMYALTAAIVLQGNDGKGLADQPMEILDRIVVIAGGALAVTALLARALLHRRTDSLAGEQRARGLFLARITPLAMLEAGCLLAITTWLLNGSAVPSLATALMLLSIAIAIAPLQDPDRH